MQKTFVALNFAPIQARPFCHSYLNLSLISGPPGTEIIPCPYGLPNRDGLEMGVCGCWEIVGCGVWVAECRVTEYRHFSLQLKFYSPFCTNKTQDDIYLVFYNAF